MSHDFTSWAANGFIVVLLLLLEDEFHLLMMLALRLLIQVTISPLRVPL